LEEGEYAAAVARCRVDLAAAGPGARTGPEPKPVWIGLAESLAGLAHPNSRRNALAFLGRRTGAAATEDVALSGADELVAAVAERAANTAANLNSPLNTATLGWMLEENTLNVLGERLAVGQPPSSVEGLLARHTGQVGRDRSFLKEVVARCRSLDELNAQVVEENMIFLEDNSPVARVRAYDWLVGKGLAPEGYNPLDERDERRAALSRWRSGQESIR
jgi:hypothetical protein